MSPAWNHDNNFYTEGNFLLVRVELYKAFLALPFDTQFCDI